MDFPVSFLHSFRALSVLTGLFASGVVLAAPDKERGEILAKKRCASCHSIGLEDDSPNKKAPPFRVLSKRYPLDNLQESLAEGITVGHEGQEMPEFEFTPEQIDHLIAYMKSISVR